MCGAGLPHVPHRHSVNSDPGWAPCQALEMAREPKCPCPQRACFLTQSNKDTEYEQDKVAETYSRAGGACPGRDPRGGPRSRENGECGWSRAREPGARQMCRGTEWRGNRALPGQHCTSCSERRSRGRALKRRVMWSGSYFKQVTWMSVLKITGRDKDRSQEGVREVLCRNLGQR